jgi:hypothetical protein
MHITKSRFWLLFYGLAWCASILIKPRTDAACDIHGKVNAPDYRGHLCSGRAFACAAAAEINTPHFGKFGASTRERITKMHLVGHHFTPALSQNINLK